MVNGMITMTTTMTLKMTITQVSKKLAYNKSVDMCTSEQQAILNSLFSHLVKDIVKVNVNTEK